MRTLNGKPVSADEFGNLHCLGCGQLVRTRYALVHYCTCDNHQLKEVPS